MFTEYGELSTQVYQITKPVGTSLGGDLEYYQDRLLPLKGKVLEAGVGTGRLLIPFLKQGIDMIGVDLSPYMLDLCRENCKEHGVTPKLYQQDLRTLKLPYQFDAIIMPTGSFSLLPGRAAALETLIAFREHLVEGGQLLVDLELPVDFSMEGQSVSSFATKEQGGILFTSTPVSLDWAEQKTVTLHRYEKWEKGELVKSELSQFVLYWYGLEEFKLLLKKAGFHTVSVAFQYGKSNHYQSIATFTATV